MRDSQDRSGHVSDASGTYTATADDDASTTVLIPTALISYPHETQVTAGTSPSVSSVEIANSDGTTTGRGDDVDEHDPYLKVTLSSAIAEGETINWTARVTPSDEYATTGLFIARPVEDRNGAGPWQIDLRGVAASQESRERIVYTASSSDAGIAVANVDSDGYTLDVNPQRSGTAVITVTGEIDGAGTATDTFQVTVE